MEAPDSLQEASSLAEQYMKGIYEAGRGLEWGGEKSLFGAPNLPCKLGAG